jgi:hypothetical protein
MAELKMAVQAMDQSGYKTLLSSLAAWRISAGLLLRFDDSQLMLCQRIPCWDWMTSHWKCSTTCPHLALPSSRIKFPLKLGHLKRRDAVLGFRSAISLLGNVMAMIARVVSGQTVEISKHQQRTNSRRKEKGTRQWEKGEPQEEKGGRFRIGHYSVY